jgi:hypothetical protein
LLCEQVVQSRLQTLIYLELGLDLLRLERSAFLLDLRVLLLKVLHCAGQSNEHLFLVIRERLGELRRNLRFPVTLLSTQQVDGCFEVCSSSLLLCQCISCILKKALLDANFFTHWRVAGLPSPLVVLPPQQLALCCSELMSDGLQFFLDLTVPLLQFV